MQPLSEHNQAAHQAGESPWAFWRSVAITLVVALGIRQFLVEARYIPSGSMLPGLQIQDRLLVEKLTYRRRAPRRGEIVVFHSPHHFDPVLASSTSRNPLRCALVNLPVLGNLPGLASPACDAYIKRVVALPGERVVVDPRGKVTIDGQPVSWGMISFVPENPRAAVATARIRNGDFKLDEKLGPLLPVLEAIAKERGIELTQLVLPR